MADGLIGKAKLVGGAGWVLLGTLAEGKLANVRWVNEGSAVAQVQLAIGTGGAPAAGDMYTAEMPVPAFTVGEDTGICAVAGEKLWAKSSTSDVTVRAHGLQWPSVLVGKVLLTAGGGWTQLGGTFAKSMSINVRFCNANAAVSRVMVSIGTGAAADAGNLVTFIDVAPNRLYEDGALCVGAGEKLWVRSLSDNVTARAHGTLNTL